MVIVALLRAARVPPENSVGRLPPSFSSSTWRRLKFVAPAVRAVWMAAALTAGKWLRREVDLISSLLVAVAAILVFEPLALWQAGFRLSVLCVAGIALLLPLFEFWLGHRAAPEDRGAAAMRWATGSILVTLAVTVMIIPTQLWYFQQFNWLSVPRQPRGRLAVPPPFWPHHLPR